MKTSILLLIPLFAFAACQKAALVLPDATPVTTSAAIHDTIPDDAVFMIQLVKDSLNYDETMFVFNQTSDMAFEQGEDAAYFQGEGEESLASLSDDGHALAINHLPYKPAMSVKLYLNTKTDGTYFLKMGYEKKIPANIEVWVKDTYLKDSVNVSKGAYNFAVSKADTNSFGSNRFRLIIKSSNN